MAGAKEDFVSRKRRTSLHGRETEQRSEKLNKFRKENGLKPNILKKRACLRCDFLFLSESHTNRLCYNCSHYAHS